MKPYLLAVTHDRLMPLLHTYAPAALIIAGADRSDCLRTWCELGKADGGVGVRLRAQEELRRQGWEPGSK